MRLAIDCGNTNTKFGLYEGDAPSGHFVRVFRLDTDTGLTAADYRARFAALTGQSLDICRCCGGQMIEIATLPRARRPTSPMWCDSS